MASGKCNTSFLIVKRRVVYFLETGNNFMMVFIAPDVTFCVMWVKQLVKPVAGHYGF